MRCGGVAAGPQGSPGHIDNNGNTDLSQTVNGSAAHWMAWGVSIEVILVA